MNTQPGAGPPAPERRSWPRRHPWKTAFAGLAGFIVLITVISVAAGGGKTGTTAAQQPATPAASPATTTAPPAPPAPSPDGSFQGSCDYQLGDDPAGGTAVLVGEVDLDNTGNIGTVVHVRITWPQEGAAPVAATRTVRVPAGAQGQPARFRLHASVDVIESLQSWQERHDFKDGCTYAAEITGTYGPVTGS